MIMRRSISEKSFDLFNSILMLFVVLTIILPFAYLIIVSLTNQTNFRYFFLPTTKWSLISYISALTTKLFRAFIVSVLRVMIGTTLNMVFTCMLAYVISRNRLPGKTFITLMMVITMLINAGLIPSYLLISNVLHLRGNYLVYILPGLISAYNTILLRNSFQRAPIALEESIKIDGGSDWHVLFNVMIPVSLPAIATIALFYAVGHWNAWFDSVLYMSDTSKYTMQVVLRSITVNTELATQMGNQISGAGEFDIVPEAIIAATMILTTIPIVCVYPFVQRYFVKGMVLGSVKE